VRVERRRGAHFLEPVTGFWHWSHAEGVGATYCKGVKFLRVDGIEDSEGPAEVAAHRAFSPLSFLFIPTVSAQSIAQTVSFDVAAVTFAMWKTVGNVAEFRTAPNSDNTIREYILVECVPMTWSLRSIENDLINSRSRREPMATMVELNPRAFDKFVAATQQDPRRRRRSSQISCTTALPRCWSSRSRLQIDKRQKSTY